MPSTIMSNCISTAECVPKSLSRVSTNTLVRITLCSYKMWYPCRQCRVSYPSSTLSERLSSESHVYARARFLYPSIFCIDLVDSKILQSVNCTLCEAIIYILFYNITQNLTKCLYSANDCLGKHAPRLCSNECTPFFCVLARTF